MVIFSVFMCLFHAISVPRQPGDDSKMLVCDTCDKGYHTFCLKPIMTTIPKNGWKCKVGDSGTVVHVHIITLHSLLFVEIQTSTAIMTG